MSNEIEFAKGLYFNPPHERAPDFVLGSLSIRPDDFSSWLSEQVPNERGYVRIAIKRSRDGKVYAALDTWQPDGQRGSSRPKRDEWDDAFDDDATVPF